MINVVIFVYILIFGLIIGSFLNCFIWRLKTGEGLWNRSYCPKCKHKISWFDNIPVLSYLALGAKCRHCKKGISIQYPLVEFFTALLFVLIFFKHFGYNFEITYNLQVMGYVFRDWFIIMVMVVVFIYDLRWYLILDKVTIPAIIIIFISNIFLGVGYAGMLIAALIGGGFFLLQFVVSKGKWIGGGDIRLGVLMGVILSWPNILVGLMLAYVIGSFIGVGLILFGFKKWGSQIPFGIFLTTATILAMFFGNSLINWYLEFL